MAIYGAIFLTSQELGLEVHLVEGVNGLIVVGLNLTYMWYRVLAICDLGQTLARHLRGRSFVGRLQMRLARFVWSGVGALQTTQLRTVASPGDGENEGVESRSDEYRRMDR